MMLRNWTMVRCPRVAGARGPPCLPRANCELPTPTPSTPTPLATFAASTRHDGDEPDAATPVFVSFDVLHGHDRKEET